PAPAQPPPFLAVYYARRFRWCGCEMFRADSAVRSTWAIPQFRRPRFLHSFHAIPEGCTRGRALDTDPPQSEFPGSVWESVWNQVPGQADIRSRSSRFEVRVRAAPRYVLCFL